MLCCLRCLLKWSSILFNLCGMLEVNAHELLKYVVVEYHGRSLFRLLLHLNNHSVVGVHLRHCRRVDLVRRSAHGADLLLQNKLLVAHVADVCRVRLEIDQERSKCQRLLIALHGCKIVLVYVGEVHVHNLLSFGNRLNHTTLKNHLVRLIDGKVTANLQSTLVNEEVQSAKECGEFITLGQHLALMAHLLDS